mgnify:CR=1 FL=1
MDPLTPPTPPLSYCTSCRPQLWSNRTDPSRLEGAEITFPLTFVLPAGPAAPGRALVGETLPLVGEAPDLADGAALAGAPLTGIATDINGSKCGCTWPESSRHSANQRPPPPPLPPRWKGRWKSPPRECDRCESTASLGLRPSLLRSLQPLGRGPAAEFKPARLTRSEAVSLLGLGPRSRPPPVPLSMPAF